MSVKAISLIHCEYGLVKAVALINRVYIRIISSAVKLDFNLSVSSTIIGMMKGIKRKFYIQYATIVLL